MSGYTKLFSSILASTIWREPDHVRIVFITMLAMSTKDGVVEASVPGLADMARVSLELCEQALVVLESPDPYSRTKDNEGRRIARVDGGFLLLNHRKYRESMSAEDRREYQRKYRARYRAEGRDSQRSTLVNIGQQMSTGSIHTDPAPDPGVQRSVKPTPPLCEMQNGRGPTGISGAELILRDKELARVEARIKAIRDSYESHSDMSQKDRAEIKALKARATELKQILGMSV